MDIKLTTKEWGETCGENHGTFYRLDNWYPILEKYTFKTTVRNNPLSLLLLICPFLPSFLLFFSLLFLLLFLFLLFFPLLFFFPCLFCCPFSLSYFLLEYVSQFTRSKSFKKIQRNFKNDNDR